MTGLTYDTLGNSRLALEFYDKAILAEEYYPEPWNNKGAILHKQGHRKEAIKCFEKAAEMGSREAKNNLAILKK